MPRERCRWAIPRARSPSDFPLTADPGAHSAGAVPLFVPWPSDLLSRPGPQQVRRSRPGSRGTGRIQQRGDVVRVATHRRREGPHPEARTFEDVAQRGSEFVVIGWLMRLQRA
jgi:hypothetical protein